MAEPKMLVGPVLHFERHCWLGVGRGAIGVGSGQGGHSSGFTWVKHTLLPCYFAFSSNSLFVLFCFQQSYAPAPHPMAPPSPSTNSSNNSSNNSSGEQLSKTNLYIRGLPPGTTDQDLIKLCQP